MNPTIPRPLRLLPSCAFAALLSVSLSGVRAASFTWDASGANPAAPTSGAGTWSTTNANWSNTAADVVWTNGSGATSNDAVITGSSAITLGSAVTVRNITNTGTTTITGGTLTLDSGSSTGTGSGNAGPILIGGTGLTISSVITGTRGLAVNGGTVTLSGANTYTGNTLISNGTLKLGATNTLATSTSLITFGSGRTFDLNGFSQTVSSLQGSNGIVKNSGGGTSTLTLNGSSNASTGQSIINAINLVKQGTYTQTLTGSQAPLSYTGTTTISGGVLRLSTASSGLTGTSAVTIDGGSLVSVAAGNLALGLGHFSMSSGSITPGETGVASSFTLAANKNFTTTGGTLNFDIGSSFDQILGSGTGTFSLTDTTLALTGDVSVAGSYALFSGFASGSVDNLTITGLDPSLTGVLGSDGILTISLSSVPEPSTYAVLAGAAIFGVAASRRRRTATA
jgi:autotransporter-associated beta strand protein